jgi:hypothetical protein
LIVSLQWRLFSRSKLFTSDLANFDDLFAPKETLKAHFFISSLRRTKIVHDLLGKDIGLFLLESV